MVVERVQSPLSDVSCVRSGCVPRSMQNTIRADCRPNVIMKASV